MTAILDNRLTFARPFLIAVTLSMAGMFVWWILQGVFYGAGGPENLTQITIVGLLFIIETVGHWYCPRLPKKWLLAYLLAQTVLIFLTNVFSKYLAFAAVLNLSLMGEMIGFFESLGLAVLAYCMYTVALMLSYPLIIDYFSNNIFVLLLWNNLIAVIASSPYYGAFFLIVRSRRQAQNLFRELDIAHRQLAVYADQVEQLTLSAERARMARELHDTLAQGVAGMGLQLEALDAYLQQGNIEKSQQIVTQVKGRARTALSDSRQAIDDLRILPNRPDGLLDAIREEAERFSAATGVACTLDLPPILTLQTSTMEHTLRCITESLSNIARHARAKHVLIRIAVIGDQLTLQIRDDGIGFDQKRVAPTGHYGLLGLRERARLIGGILDIQSAPGAGTDVQLKIAIRG